MRFFFKHDVIHARLFQVVADGEAGLTASDDDDGIVIVHAGQFSLVFRGWAAAKRAMLAAAG